MKQPWARKLTNHSIYNIETYVWQIIEQTIFHQAAPLGILAFSYCLFTGVCLLVLAQYEIAVVFFFLKGKNKKKETKSNLKR